LSISAFFKEPLAGKTSLSRVFWLYGIAGSLVYGALEFFLNPENQFLMRLYSIVGILYMTYATVAMYKCAANCKSPAVARAARIGAVISLLLLPFVAYLELTGSLTLSSLMGDLPE
jgi:apolipoprotein N-acyltransferase